MNLVSFVCHDELRQAGALVAMAHDISTAVSWLERLGFLRGKMQ
jgi:hypothetical protein